MKTYLSRREAAAKYNVSIAKLRRLEETGKLRRIDATDVERNTKGLGAAAKWVYDEDQLMTLVGASPSNHIVPRNRETQVLDMLVEGKNVIEIARQTKLPVREVQQLRDIYERETQGMFLPGPVVAAIRDAIAFRNPEELLKRILYLKRTWREALKQRDHAERVAGLPQRQIKARFIPEEEPDEFNRPFEPPEKP